jgi:hypothetical protein
MEQIDQSADSTEQPTSSAEQAGKATVQTETSAEQPRGIVRGLIEAAKIIIGMLVFIGLAIFSASHHPHPPVQH